MPSRHEVNAATLEAPTIYAAYRASGRNSKLLRVFLDYLVEVFAELERERASASLGGVLRTAKPEWLGRTRGRASAYAARRHRSAA